MIALRLMIPAITLTELLACRYWVGMRWMTAVYVVMAFALSHVIRDRIVTAITGGDWAKPKCLR